MDITEMSKICQNNYFNEHANISFKMRLFKYCKSGGAFTFS